MFYIHSVDRRSKRLYRGLRPVLITICVANFIYFYVYHSLKSFLLSVYGKGGNGMVDLMTALVAGEIAIWDFLLDYQFWTKSISFVSRAPMF